MSDEIVTTTGRPMTRGLQEAVDNITGGNRTRMIRALEAGTKDRHLDRLMRALAGELRLAQLREDETLRRIKQHEDAGVVEPPLPPAEGGPWFPPDDTP